MEHIAFAQIGDLAEYMINRVEDKEYIVAALFFDNAVELMRSLLLPWKPATSSWPAPTLAAAPAVSMHPLPLSPAVCF